MKVKNRLKQEQDNKKQDVISPLAKDMTYGERVYDTVFNKIINFWLNLVVSAGFTYWVNHTRSTFNLPWVGHNRPAAFQDELSRRISKTPIMNVFKDIKVRENVADSMAGVATLTAAGHVIMIPSVWLGAKIKAPLVQWLNKRHYGEAAMEDPSLKTRHALIEAEERPTLFGAILGRAGTILATQTTAYTLGGTINLMQWFGKKLKLPALASFKGIDHFTSLAGDKLGGAVTEMMPTTMSKINHALGKRFTWSLRQVQDHPELLTENVPYGGRSSTGTGGGVAEHYGKFKVSDILYTEVTAMTIKPAINFLNRFVPGITYKPKISAETQALVDRTDRNQMHVKPNPVVVRDEVEAPARTVDAVAMERTGVRHNDRTSGKRTNHAEGRHSQRVNETATPTAGLTA